MRFQIVHPCLDQRLSEKRLSVKISEIEAHTDYCFYPDWQINLQVLNLSIKIVPIQKFSICQKGKLIKYVTGVIILIMSNF